MAVGEGRVMAMMRRETGGQRWRRWVYVRHPHGDLTTHDPNLCCEHNQQHNEETMYNMQRPPGRCHGMYGGTQELGARRGVSPYVGVGCGCAMGGVRAQGKQVGGGGLSEREGAWVRSGGARNMGARVWGAWR